MLGILSAGLAPGMALLSYFYLKDEYGTEPVSVVSKSFFFGAILVFPIMFIQYVLTAEGVVHSPWIDAFLSAGLLEEFFKWFILFYTVYQHVAFDEPYDGIVYGAAVSLGFATSENIFYLIGNGIEHALGRAILPVSSHAVFGVVMGYYMGKGKFSKTQRRKWISLSLFLPIILHGSYDFILVSQENWLLYIMPFMIFLWWFGIRKVKLARALSTKHFENQFQL